MNRPANRVVIHLIGACPLCAGAELKAELLDWEIEAVIPCPLCGDPKHLRDFVEDHKEHLQRPREVSS